jgi:hypothetical protein
MYDQTQGIGDDFSQLDGYSYFINVFILHLNLASQSCMCCCNLYCNYFYSHDVFFFSLYVTLAPLFHVPVLCLDLPHVPTIYIMAIPFMITSSFLSYCCIKTFIFASTSHLGIVHVIPFCLTILLHCIWAFFFLPLCHYRS